MKLQIINLEAEDDHVSTRDKLSWSKADHAVLVWPRRGNPLSNQLDLALVYRYARRRGIQLGLISYQHAVRQHAARLGIPIFDSLEALPAGAWTESGTNGHEFARRPPEELAELQAARDSLQGAGGIQFDERVRRAILGTVIAALLAVVVIVTPGAELTLDPNTSVVRELVTLIVDPGLLNGPLSNRIPGQRITRRVGGELQTDPTGSVRQPNTAAEGEVVFSNLTDEEVLIPAETGLRAGVVRFLTLRAVTLEAGPGATANVRIVAAEPGRSGNVAAEEIDAVEGPLGFLVQVHNPLPTLGGRDIRAEAVSEDDQQQLRQALIEQLLAQAEQQFQAEFEGARILIPESMQIVRVIDERYDRQVGEAAPSLALSMEVELQGIAFLQADAVEAASQLMAASRPESLFVIPDSISITPVESTLVGDRIRIDLRARAELARQIDAAKVRQLARAVPRGQAGARLQQAFGLAEPAEIAVRPGWFPWMPLLEMRIFVHWSWETGQ